MTDVQDNDYTKVATARNVNLTLPAAYDEKDDMDSLKLKLQRRKKPIYAGLVFLILVIIGVSIGVSTGTKSTANTESAQDTMPSSGSSENESSMTSQTPVQTQVDTDADIDQSVQEDSTIDASSATKGATKPAEVVGKASSGLLPSTNSTDTPSISTSTLPPSDSVSQSPPENALAYAIVDFDWTDASKWEYASGATVSATMVTSSGITLTPDNSAEPIRTKEGWSGEKVVYVEWERSSTSDTNIWMLNTKLGGQFQKGNGWPYWGELDLFEMFTQDAISMPAYDFSGFGSFTDVSSYGQLTMHMGPATEDGSPCFCPASPTKSLWYDNTPSMTSGCTAQFSNDASNSIAAVWGSDSTGKYIQLIQNPIITKGGKLNNVDTYDVAPGSGGVTSKIYNNADLFWGVDATAPCATAGGHNAATGFPFFESFRLVLEEQKKGDPSASFTVKNIQIFTKN